MLCARGYVGVWGVEGFVWPTLNSVPSPRLFWEVSMARGKVISPIRAQQHAVVKTWTRRQYMTLVM